jgi:hypothetical protein
MLNVWRLLILVLVFFFPLRSVWSDGKVVPPRDYAGSLEEKSQEAIIIFQGSEADGESIEHLILKIRVEGDAEKFAWVIPFPRAPKIEKEQPALFRDLFDYVEHRRSRPGKGESSGEKSAQANDAEAAVQVIERKIVGSYDVAVVRENTAGGLQAWLQQESFQPLEAAEDVLEFYRQKNYVFACIKVDSELLTEHAEIESHPLRFSFSTGGRDGIFFPMKMTGLQETPFDVNLYVFYRYWINDRKSKYGYAHRGFDLHYRDWDSSQCVPDGGKAYSLPESDPFLRGSVRWLGSVTELMQRLAPGETFYLTNIQAHQLKPAAVRQWSDDLWLFPYYTNPDFVPYDVRGDGPASEAWPNDEANASAEFSFAQSGTRWVFSLRRTLLAIGIISGLIAIAALFYQLGRHRSEKQLADEKGTGRRL